MYLQPKKLFTYSQKIKRLSYQQFSNFIKKLNAAGFWQLSYSQFCKNAPADGYSLMIECNSGKKYNVFFLGFCKGENSELRKVCQEIIDFADDTKSIHLY